MHELTTITNYIKINTIILQLKLKMMFLGDQPTPPLSNNFALSEKQEFM